MRLRITARLRSRLKPRYLGWNSILPCRLLSGAKESARLTILV
jgi:hypothetical protein